MRNIVRFMIVVTWNYRIASRYRSCLISAEFVFIPEARAVARAPLICIAVQRGAMVSSEKLHDGTVAPVWIDGLGICKRDACSINASANACKFLSTRSLRDVSVLSACRSLLPHPSRRACQRSPPHPQWPSVYGECVRYGSINLRDVSDGRSILHRTLKIFN